MKPQKNKGLILWSSLSIPAALDGLNLRPQPRADYPIYFQSSPPPLPAARIRHLKAFPFQEYPAADPGEETYFEDFEPCF